MALVCPVDADGVVRPARPKGSAVTAEGRFAVISGDPRLNQFAASGAVWVIDLRRRAVSSAPSPAVVNDP